MHRQVRLGQQHDAGDAGLVSHLCSGKALEQFADGRQPGGAHRRCAQRAQVRRIGHQGGIAAAIEQIGGEVQALHEQIIGRARQTLG